MRFLMSFRREHISAQFLLVIIRFLLRDFRPVYCVSVDNPNMALNYVMILLALPITLKRGGRQGYRKG